VHHDHAEHRDRACRVDATHPPPGPTGGHGPGLGEAGIGASAYRAAAHRSSIHASKRNMKRSETTTNATSIIDASSGSLSARRSKGSRAWGRPRVRPRSFIAREQRYRLTRGEQRRLRVRRRRSGNIALK
jgi:hypothetical protein